MAQILSEIFKKNRAEEFPDDLWNTFVLPMEYEQCNLLANKKGVHVVGGRGTGKTMFLKYHCYPTQLSDNRECIEDKDIECIGIYWRPDTHYVHLINQKYLGDMWEAVFNTYVGLSIIMKFSRFVQKLIKSNYNNQSVKNALKMLQISPILQEELKCQEQILYTQLHKHCNEILYKIQNWLNNPHSKEIPLLIDGKASLLFIINEIKESELLENTLFHVFIDEFENLTIDQQGIINTWMKHGEAPLIYSIAYKKYADKSIDTVGIEKTQRRNDHRILDIIDDVYAKTDNAFKVFASEIIASKLEIFLTNKNLIPLSDRKQLTSRRPEKYQKEMLDLSNKIFPEKTYEEIAQDMLLDKTIYEKVKKNIAQALSLKNSQIDPLKFLDKDYAAASLVNSIVLYRGRTEPDKLLLSFNAYKKDSKLQPEYKELIANNIVASILHIYTFFSQRICPIYSGFNRFCLMSRNNLRHLLELCYQSFLEFETQIQDYDGFHEKLPIVPVEVQVKAAKYCSKQELETIEELGAYGQNLQKIANRLGRIFYLKQRIRTQSKPENIHFSVETLALNTVDQEIKILINQAMLWNVLQEFDATKGTTDNIATKEYMLTPMLAPYYTISPRKIHKVDFTVEQLKTIFLESDEKFDILYAHFMKEWKVDEKPENIKYNLFGELF